MLADAAATEKELDSIFSCLPSDSVGRVIEAMVHTVMAGGKRLRASLVLGATRLATGSDELPSGAIRVAAAYECLHAYSLIHDDLPAMDNAALRRGKPACHIAYDEATAILAGDGLQSLAFEILASSLTGASTELRVSLLELLAKASGVAGMVGGQMLDIEAEGRKMNFAEMKRMQEMKTGALIKAAVLSGGMIGGASSTLLEGLASYGESVGLAFQIADDLLDKNSDPKTLGKPAQQDAAADKASFVHALGFEAASAEADRLVNKAHESLSEAVGYATPQLTYMLDLADFTTQRQA